MAEGEAEWGLSEDLGRGSGVSGAVGDAAGRSIGVVMGVEHSGGLVRWKGRLGTAWQRVGR